MKPIASRRDGWVIVPSCIKYNAADSMLVVSDEKNVVSVCLGGITFSQFIDLYNACPNSIFVID